MASAAVAIFFWRAVEAEVCAAIDATRVIPSTKTAQRWNIAYSLGDKRAGAKMIELANDIAKHQSDEAKNLPRDRCFQVSCPFSRKLGIKCLETNMTWS